MSHSNALGSLQTLLSSVNLASAKPVAAPKAGNRTDAAADRGPATRSPQLADKAQLSSISSVVAQGLTGSDVRTEKVAALRQSIDDGTYHVPADQVAGKLLESMLK